MWHTMQTTTIKCACKQVSYNDLKVVVPSWSVQWTSPESGSTLHALVQSTTHSLASSSRNVPVGHWQPSTHSVMQAGLGFAQVGGQALPHSMYTCPSIGQGSEERKVMVMGVSPRHDIKSLYTFSLCLVPHPPPPPPSHYKHPVEMYQWGFM